MGYLGNVFRIRPLEYGLLNTASSNRKCTGPISVGQRSLLLRLGLSTKEIERIIDSERACYYIVAELNRLAQAIKSTGYPLSSNDSQSAERLLRAMEYSPLTLDQFNTARTTYP